MFGEQCSMPFLLIRAIRPPSGRVGDQEKGSSGSHTWALAKLEMSLSRTRHECSVGMFDISASETRISEQLQPIRYHCRRPLGAPRRARDAPRRFQEATRKPKEAPRQPQDAQLGTQKAP